ncbi:MAG: PKD domain-containing protein [Candidatus Cloacimonas sp.]|jgi:hypothetical protein|nr:PKD domain-containing protein [Candidatus Cloacimonas sp.]
MKHSFLILALLILLLFVFSAFDKDKPDAQGITTSAALSNYWQYQTELNGSLADRDNTMTAIATAITNMNTKSGKDAFAEIDALVETYVAQSNSAAADFNQLILAENAIVSYGDDKGILTSIAKGILNTAKDGVVSSACMVRGGWRVLSGKQTIKQVLRDPETSIPIFSNWAATVQKRNSDRDALIREAILNWDPITSPVDTNHLLPYNELPGNTPQEKVNAYNNLDDEDPIKLSTRSAVITWDHDESVATAKAAVELGETGVKAVANTVGNEYVNEVLLQHMEEGQSPNQQGTLTITVKQDGGTNPIITAPKTIIISKANMPEGDPRITMILDAPANLVQPLPTGSYNIMVIADGFIRSVAENMTIIQGQANDVIAKMLKLADNPIIFENLSVDEGSILVGEPVTAKVSCLSTIGKTLSFAWAVNGGTYTGFSASGTQLTFTPTEEKEYTISVTVTDDTGNTKTRSLAVTSLGGKLVIDDWEISGENFNDAKLNPGENATITLFVSNTGSTDITGTQAVSGSNGITANFTPAYVTIAAGGTRAVNVPVSLASSISVEEVSLQYSMNTVNENQIPAIITDLLIIPLDFYVTVNPITELVEERVVTISGKVANPQLTTAVLIVDNDMEHAYDLNLTNGNFAQQIVLTGSLAQVAHSVRVLAVSGGLTAEGTISFNSLVPLMSLRTTLTWNTDGTDVDFWITDPNGEKCYYNNSTTASGLMLDVDDTNGYGPENITSANIIPGNYLVQVHYYSDHDPDNAIGTDCQVVIVQDEGSALPPVNYYGFLGDSGDIWTVTTLHYNPVKGWTIKPINRYAKVDSSTLPAK